LIVEKTINKFKIFQATTAMMDFHDDNNAQLSENQFNVLVLISDGEHRDAWRKKQVTQIIINLLIKLVVGD